MDLRDTLFGDAPLSLWVSEARPTTEPWATLAQARDAQGAGRAAEAINLLQKVAATPGLEARHTLEAWNALRQLGVAAPPDVAKRVYGVVVEVAMGTGHDVLAGYADRTARYLNYSGSAVIWDAPDGRFDADIAALLDAGARIVAHIGPWEEPRRTELGAGNVRLSMLTPSGLHFGEGPMEALMGDGMAGPLLAAAIRLLQGMTALQGK